MKLTKKILILGDERVGTYSQAIALAKESGYEYEILFLKYNFLKIIPNIFLQKSAISLTKDSFRQITQLKYCPDFIISAGRRSAPIALFLKKYLKKKYHLIPKIIQIMRPELNLKLFDTVIIPQHDKILQSNARNVINSIGSLTKVDIDDNNSIYQKFSHEFSQLSKPIITLLIGGDTKNKQLTPEHIEYLVNQSILLREKLQGTLIIMNSRRTSPDANFAIKKFNSPQLIFFDYPQLKENPYYSILNASDYFIVSGDSVSMISECCSTGKPVYIYSNQQFCSTKHQKFHQILIDNNFARFFDDKIFENPYFKPLKLEEAKRIAKLIF